MDPKFCGCLGDIANGVEPRCDRRSVLGGVLTVVANIETTPGCCSRGSRVSSSLSWARSTRACTSANRATAGSPGAATVTRRMSSTSRRMMGSAAGSLDE